MTTEYGPQFGILDFQDAKRLVTERLDSKVWDRSVRFGKSIAFPGDPIPFQKLPD